MEGSFDNVVIGRLRVGVVS